MGLVNGKKGEIEVSVTERTLYTNTMQCLYRHSIKKPIHEAKFAALFNVINSMKQGDAK